MKRLVLAALIVYSLLTLAQETKLTAPDVLAKSLNAIGTPELLKSVQYYELTGTATVRTTAGTGTASGTALLVSEGKMVKFATKFPDLGDSYKGDQVLFDGKDVKVSDIKPGVHSKLGELILWQQIIVKNGLLGGAISHAWPVYDLNACARDFTFEGKAKVDGRETYRIGYRPKKLDSALTVFLFFDADTFRHIRTTYKVEVPAGFTQGTSGRGIGTGRLTQTITDQNSYYELEETFADFRTISGLTLPTKHKLTYASNGNVTSNWFWEMTYNELNGVKLNP